MLPDSSQDSALARGYAPPSSCYDEMLGADGQPRAHWGKLLQGLSALGKQGLDRRWDKARHLLHENGVSYNVYGDPHGMERPWNLSPLPVVIDADEWARLETGLAQRARLLAALLADLYGPQHVLLEGLLPPELLFENPCFLRACHGMSVPRELWLPLYAADLVRRPDGQFAVLADRTQAPTGAGYALENRIVLSSVLPEAFRDCNVARLSTFFRALRDTLTSLAPHNRDNPRIVVLTPGPYNATYFEQAYLAQYLGYTLVDGGDLTVREDRVYLKTLGGLQPVDVILRRVNDDYCDPLELRPESVLGVPGLVQAARAGNAAIASPLGSSLLQTHAMLPYLGRLSQALLGEPLRLPSVRTWWCGDRDTQGEALSLLDDAVVKPAYPGGFVQPIFTAQLEPHLRDELRARIQANPRRFVVQEHVRASTTPVLHEGVLVPRALVMRCYAVAGRDAYVVMPGALSRVAGATPGTEVTMQLGAGSKDTWVLSPEPVSSFTLLPPQNRPVDLSRGGSDLPSRAADHLYWLGRYAERAEGVARLARVVCARLSELSSQRELVPSAELVRLLCALHAQTSLLYSAPLDGHTAPTLPLAQAQLMGAVFDEQLAGSLRSVVRSTLRSGRMVRDRISSDTWRVLAALDEERETKPVDLAEEPLETLQEVLHRTVLGLAAFSGQVMENMTRGQAFRFLDMGRRIERAMTLVTLLRATLGSSAEREAPLLEAVLEIADSSMTYRRRYLAKLQVAPVVDLLLTDETNPRSVIFQLEALSQHLEALPSAQDALLSPQKRIALGALCTLKLVDVDRITAPEGASRPRFSELMLELATRIPALSDSLTDQYLAHATVSRHLRVDEGPLPLALHAARGGES